MRRILQSGQIPIRPISWHEWVPTWTYSQASYVQTLPRIHEIIMSIRPTPRNPTLPCRDGGVLHRCNPCEIGGRWNDESLRLVAQLVRSRAMRAPGAPLRGAATQGWYRRWWGLYSVWLCKTHLLPLCSGRRPSMPLCLARRHRLGRTSCTTRAPLQPLCRAVARRCTGAARGSPEKAVG